MRPPVYQDIILGIKARKTLSEYVEGISTKTITYRVRTGNGYYGSILGKKYQDIMDYKVVNDPKLPEQQEWRGAFKTKVAEAMALSPEERLPYIKKAKRRKGWWWVNAYLHEHLKP